MEDIMTQRYTRRFRVRHYELDLFGHVNHVVFVQYMQEAAIEACTHLGFPPDWFRDRGVGWVVRRLTIRYLAQLSYGEEIEVNTWVSQMRGVRSVREYDLIRVRDGARVARGRAEWIYIDRKTSMPTRFPDGWVELFQTTGAAEAIDVRLGNGQLTERAHRYVSRRRVQFNEVDTARHVNHTVYLRWIGEAYFDAMRAAGHPPERTTQEGWFAFQGGHEIEYFLPALDNDNIEVVSWICEVGKVRGAWTHEVYNSDTKKLLARDYSLGVFVNRDGRPMVPPAQAVEEVVRGPQAAAPPAG
jgi:YbgC/YbaW family acyl-CoA thioester hydrolase